MEELHNNYLNVHQFLYTIETKREKLLVYIYYDKFWRSEFFNNVTTKSGVEEINLSQLQLKVNDSYKKNETITTKFEPSDKKDVVDKDYLYTELPKLERHMSFTEKITIEYKLRNVKQSEDVFIGRAVKITMEILFDKY